GASPAAGANPLTAMDKLVLEFKKAVAELNTKEFASIRRSSAPVDPHVAKYHTWPKCAECHLKQFDFWRKTPHASALLPLIAANQAKNKACIGCHSVGFLDKDGFEDVNAMVERRILT